MEIIMMRPGMMKIDKIRDILLCRVLYLNLTGLEKYPILQSGQVSNLSRYKMDTEFRL